MLKELNSLIDMKDTYEKQAENLRNNWAKGKSRYDNAEDYQQQLSIWESRIKEYDNRIAALESGA